MALLGNVSAGARLHCQKDFIVTSIPGVAVHTVNQNFNSVCDSAVKYDFSFLCDLTMGRDFNWSDSLDSKVSKRSVGSKSHTTIDWYLACSSQKLAACNHSEWWPLTGALCRALSLLCQQKPCAETPPQKIRKGRLLAQF
eukprot:6492582-Amphidinium_carterae.1